jgi:hypothetical protein
MALGHGTTALEQNLTAVGQSRKSLGHGNTTLVYYTSATLQNHTAVVQNYLTLPQSQTILGFYLLFPKGFLKKKLLRKNISFFGGGSEMALFLPKTKKNRLFLILIFVSGWTHFPICRANRKIEYLLSRQVSMISS